MIHRHSRWLWPGRQPEQRRPHRGLLRVQAQLLCLALFQLLLLDIFPYDLLIHANRAHKIPSGPKLPAPIFLSYFGHFFEHSYGHTALYRSDDLANRIFRRYGQHQMNVIARYMTLDDLDLFPFANLAHPIPDLGSYPAPQNPKSILGAENHMVVA